MDEHILVSGRGPNEPVAFSWIEPFDGAFLHRLSPMQSHNKANAAASLRTAPQPGFCEDPKHCALSGRNGRSGQNPNCGVRNMQKYGISKSVARPRASSSATVITRDLLGALAGFHISGLPGLF